MFTRSKAFRAFVITLFAASAASVQAQEVEGDPVARAYAKAFGISIDEATIRLAQLSEIRALEDSLEATDAFAGIRVVHEPDFKAVVMAKGDADALLSGRAQNPLFVAKSVPRSLDELKGAQAAALKVLTNLRVEFESEIDPETGKVTVFVLDSAEARPALAAIIRNFPFIDIVEVDGMPTPVATFYRRTECIGSLGLHLRFYCGQ